MIKRWNLSMTRWLLWRRSVDPRLLMLAITMLAIGNSIGKAVFVAFLLSGIYLALARHRARRWVDPWFCGAILLYILWTVGLVLWRGEPIVDNRLMTYAAMIAGFAALPLGLALVRRPLDALVIGGRLAMLAIVVLTVVDWPTDGQRLGLGHNEAIFAFMAAACALAARMTAVRVPTFLPNSRLWFYAALPPVLFSQTRAAWLVFALVAVFDLASLTLRSRRWVRDWRMAVGALLVLVPAAIPAATLVQTRWDQGVAEINHYNETGVATGSMDVRMVMWRGAYTLLQEHPLIGVGGADRIERVAEVVTPANAAYVRSYTHLHNVFIDEAMASGLVGVALLCSIFAVFLVRSCRVAPGRGLATSSIGLVFLVATFGSFHGVLLNEWMILIIFGFMTLVLTTLRRETLGLHTGAVVGAAPFGMRSTTRP